MNQNEKLIFQRSQAPLSLMLAPIWGKNVVGCAKDGIWKCLFILASTCLAEHVEER